jgi:hypothetical protein
MVAEFKANTRIMAIELKKALIEAHNSIGKFEYYHTLLQ